MVGEYFTMEAVSCELWIQAGMSSDVDLFDDCLIHARML